MNSENVYSAFATYIAALPGFVTVERKWQLIEDVDPSLMPYIGIKERYRRIKARTSDGVEAWLLVIDLILYVNNSDMTTPSSPIFNPLVDTIVNALCPIAVQIPTQAGILFDAHLLVNADIVFFEGWLQGKSAVHIPIEILVSDDA